MPNPYKVFYTDESSLLWSDVAPDGDPKLIPKEKRAGVHSVIQEMRNGTMREVVEQYHYIYSIRDEQWIGVGVDGLFDHIINDFDNIRCVLNGRTSATDTFWRIRDTVLADTDIIGGIDTAAHPPRAGSTYDESRWIETNPFFSSSENKADFNTWLFTENARHRAYSPEVSDPPRTGEQTWYN